MMSLRIVKDNILKSVLKFIKSTEIVQKQNKKMRYVKKEMAENAVVPFGPQEIFCLNSNRRYKESTALL